MKIYAVSDMHGNLDGLDPSGYDVCVIAGDFAKDRIIPDIIRAVSSDKSVMVRNPASIRPWQYALESVFGYMSLADCMLGRFMPDLCSAFNFGPDSDQFKDVRYIVEKASAFFRCGWKDVSGGSAPHEAGTLKLDISKAKSVLGWFPKWNINKTLDHTFGWYSEYIAGHNVVETIRSQILEYCSILDNPQ